MVDDAMIGAAADQHRWDESLQGLEVCWVGVHCSPDTAAAREAARGDRPPGNRAPDATAVHDGVRYDVEIDSGAPDLAGAVAVVTAAVGERWGVESLIAADVAPSLPVVSAADGRWCHRAGAVGALT